MCIQSHTNVAIPAHNSIGCNGVNGVSEHDSTYHVDGTSKYDSDSQEEICILCDDTHTAYVTDDIWGNCPDCCGDTFTCCTIEHVHYDAAAYARALGGFKKPLAPDGGGE
jgi:hypothetical protein